jgi:hypothetical protein
MRNQREYIRLKQKLTLSRPDSPFVVFYGESSESHETELRGKLVLTNPESLSVRSVRITLTGTRKVSYATNLFE